jgi:hypothetical protein
VLWLNLGIPTPGEVLEGLNPVKHYEEEIKAYENGCGYWESVAHGIEGAFVAATDLAGLEGAGRMLSESRMAPLSTCFVTRAVIWQRTHPRTGLCSKARSSQRTTSDLTGLESQYTVKRCQMELRSGVRVEDDRVSGDPAALDDWVDAVNEMDETRGKIAPLPDTKHLKLEDLDRVVLKSSEAFLALQPFLLGYYYRTNGKEDISALCSSVRLKDDHTSSDPTTLSDWAKAINEVLSEAGD